MQENGEYISESSIESPPKEPAEKEERAEDKELAKEAAEKAALDPDGAGAPIQEGRADRFKVGLKLTLKPESYAKESHTISLLDADLPCERILEAVIKNAKSGRAQTFIEFLAGEQREGEDPRDEPPQQNLFAEKPDPDFAEVEQQVDESQEDPREIERHEGAANIEAEVF